MTRNTAAALLPLLLTACTHLSDQDLAERMDLDGDGVPRPTDCDDQDTGVRGPMYFWDQDGDGYGSEASTGSCEPTEGAVANHDDCDDMDAAIFPGAPEECNERDDDCDEQIDEGLELFTWYLDFDGDGYGGTGLSAEACFAPSGYVASSDDCDDADAAVHPDAQEVCDGEDLDEDCNGVADDADPGVDESSLVTVYQDEDGDGYGVAEATSAACDPGDGWALEAGDCDDSDAGRNPDTVWYRDADEDGYGDAPYSVRACEDVVGYVRNELDCDDARSDVSPGGQEICDALDVDEDCDGLSDDADETVAGQLTIYQDSDGDGYGGDASETQACDLWSGWVLVGGDCATADPAIHPAADEIWYDGYDQDCDGWSDYDSDLDGHDDDTWGGDDCDDRAPLVNPSMAEACGDSVDNDCDGSLAGHCLLSGEIDLADADHLITGGGYVGYSLWTGVDLDGDGLEDLMLGAPGSGSPGSAYLVSGPITATSTSTAASSRLHVSADNTGFAYGFDGSGDFDGDGWNDLWVTEGWYHPLGSCGWTSVACGAAYLVYGPISTGDISMSTADAHLTGINGEEEARQSLAATGDLDGDGLDDLIASWRFQSSASESSAGTTCAFYGPVSGTMDLSSASDCIEGSEIAQFSGYAVIAGDDLTGDGVGDVVISALGDDSYGSNSGAVFIAGSFPSGTSSVLDTDAVLYGDGYGCDFGRIVASGGDYDGDGHLDLAVSGYAWDSWTGRAYLFLGPLSGARLSSGAIATVEGDDRNSYTGISMALDGDVNGDGRSDWLVGAYGAGPSYLDEGEAYLCYGPTSGVMTPTDVDAVLIGEWAGQYAGSAVAHMEDQDGDGYGEVLVGAVGGGVYMLFGGAW